jgi:hypothetical protein
VKPQQVRSYALARGWRRIPQRNAHLAVFGHANAEFEQLLVPMDDELLDYDRRLAEVVETLAGFEQRTVESILNDLLTSDADIVRFRVSSSATDRGSIPLSEGIRLLDGARRSLLAAAHSVLNPVTHHPRMGRSEAQQLLSKCHMGQTERGSFSISISCPLRAVEADHALLPGVETFSRKAVTTMMQTVSHIVQAIDADAVSQLWTPAEGQIPVSVNLCEALLQMQPPESDSHLDLGVSWAASLPPLVQVPQSIRIRHESFAIIEDVAKNLRPAQEPATCLFVGHVENVGGEPGDDGRMQGEVVLSLMLEDSVQAARVTLGPDEWLIAHAALRDHSVVRLKGILHRASRTHRITDVSEFSTLH